MVYLIVLVLLVGTVWLVGGPLLRARPRGSGAEDGVVSATELDRGERRIDLEAARDAKYREIRDAELDHQTGKLSDADFQAIDSTLRAQALALLRELDALEAGEAVGAGGGFDAPGGVEIGQGEQSREGAQ